MATRDPKIPLVDLRKLKSLPTGLVRAKEWPNGISIFTHVFSAAPKPPAPEPAPQPDTPED